MQKIIRITTVPISLQILLKGQHKFMRQYFEVVGVSSSGKALLEVAEKEGVRIVAVEMKRNISLLNDLISLWKFYWLIKKEKPTIVHTHTPKAGTLGMIASRFCGVPIRLHTVAGLPLVEAKGLKKILLKWIEKITYSCATKVYPNSFGLKNIILQNDFAKAGKLKVIGNGSSNGIDTSHFSRSSLNEEGLLQLRNACNIKPDDFVYLFIGRLVKDKGINELISAFINVNKQFPQSKLLLVGEYEQKLDPLNTATILAITNHPNIIHTGFQKDVRPFLAISQVLVFPSYREGFPNVPMQAGAMGLPCIVTDINGCNEIIIHEQNGLIIPTKNYTALEEAMIRLMDDKNLRIHLSLNARESIVSRYDQLTLWKLIKKEYDEQLQKADYL